jgi:hypothetical protein
VPNLPAHIALAHETAQRLAHPVLEANMGYYLLGSTSPDIRIITRGRREEYHFAPLEFDSIGSGVKGLFDAYPHLRTTLDDDGPDQAFVAGYLTHLIADETWIVDMYRPYFGNSDVYDDETRGKVMDRALQLEMDRQAWDTVDATLGLMADAGGRIDVGFISSETLAKWRPWVVKFLSSGFSWERLKFMAKRIAAGDDGHSAHNLANGFIDEIPRSLKELYRVVPESKLVTYKKQAQEALEAAVADYLS